MHTVSMFVALPGHFTGTGIHNMIIAERVQAPTSNDMLAWCWAPVRRLLLARSFVIGTKDA